MAMMMADPTDDKESTSCSSGLLPRRVIIYCGSCGMPPEYCEYGPDFETHCDPWLKAHHPEMQKELVTKRGASLSASKKASSLLLSSSSSETIPISIKADRPRTLLERLVAFYEKYEPSKVEGAASLLEKYTGKEDKLFEALEKKYGPEPEDPYYANSEGPPPAAAAGEEEEDGDDAEDDNGDEKGNDADKKKRRGASAKKTETGSKVLKIVVQKQAQKRKRFLTVVTGMESLPDVKLKDVAKAFAKKFAGSSSVKDNTIIVQGDHVYEAAELVVDKFHVPEEAVFLDLDGEIVPLK